MNEEDFLAVIAALEEQLLTIGAAELVDPRHYSGIESAEAAPSAKVRLLQMLSALDRQLAIEDGRTYERAMFSIRDAVRGDGPRGAVVILPDRDRTIDLAGAPDLSEPRKLLAALIAGLREVGAGPFTEGSAQ